MMIAKIRHFATYTENFDREALFYQSIFGFKKITNGLTDETGTFNPNRGHMSDGVVGVAMVQRHPGYHSGLDHIGFLVSDLETVLQRIRQNYPDILIAPALAHVPFAAIRSHDPVGTHIDISQKSERKVEGEYVQAGWEHVAKGSGSDRSFSKLREGYIEDGWDQPRQLNHIAIRAAKPSMVAEFYQKVFELRPEEGLSKNNGELCLTDGTVHLLIRPCNTESYRNMKQGLDHIGFKVENVEKVKKDLEEISKAHAQCAPKKIALGTHGPSTEKEMAACPIGKYAFSDPDGILVDISD
jgi:catechol 2,3-dioxygenase-like lactoylglutathione lyase family enzyme